MIGARELFSLFMAYGFAGGFRRKNPKKEVVGTCNVISSGGTYRRQRTGPRGKVAIKAHKRARHTRGYYHKLRTGELTA